MKVVALSIHFGESLHKSSLDVVLQDESGSQRIEHRSLLELPPDEIEGLFRFIDTRAPMAERN